jgi:hypothetical protein
MNDNFKLLPFLRVFLRNFWSIDKKVRKEAKMPGPSFRDVPSPMRMITERTGASIVSTFLVKAGVTMVALDGIRRYARRRRTYRNVTNTGEVFVVGWLIVFRASTFDNIIKDFFSMSISSVMFTAIPRKVRNPFLMGSNLYANLLEFG